MAGNVLIKNANGNTVTLQNPDTNLGDVTVDTSKIAQISNVVGFKNYIINGNFDIWQRGSSCTNVQNTQYTVDRWVHTRDGSGANINIYRGGWVEGSIETGSGDTNGSILEFDQTVAGTGCSFNTLNHRIENVQWSSGKTMTLSFNCQFMVADTIPKIWARQHFGTGGSAFVDTFIATNVNVVGNVGNGGKWDKKVFTFTLPSISGKTIGTSPYTEIIIFLPVNKVQRFRLNNVQLEEGSVATPFEQRPVGLELSLCQRYYEICTVYGSNYGVGTGTNYRMTSVPYKVSKRTIPTINLSSILYNNCNNINTEGSSVNSISVSSNASANSVSMWVSAVLTAEAEL